jgi:hypothetical protein
MKFHRRNISIFKFHKSIRRTLRLARDTISAVPVIKIMHIQNVTELNRGVIFSLDNLDWHSKYDNIKY